MEEQWKAIEGYTEVYFISNLGRVQSKRGKIIDKDGIERYYKNKILKQIISSTGYYYVSLYKNKKKSDPKFVHRLVAKAFIPNPENKPQVNHKDGNKINNNVENLEWCTPKENFDHAVANGFTVVKGEKNGYSKLRREQVIDIKGRLKAGEKHKDIAETYNVDRTTIGKINCGINWSHIQ